MSLINPKFKFPSPIGGIPFSHDFAPAVLFTVLYFFLVPLGVYRLIVKRSRAMAIIGTVIFALERVADFAIRAVEAEKPKLSTAPFYVSWLQSAYAMGFLSMAADLNNLARLFVTSTTEGTPFDVKDAPADRFPPDTEEEQPLTASDSRPHFGSSYSTLPTAEQDILADEPKLRVLLKRVGWATLALRIMAILLAVVSGALYFAGTLVPKFADIVQITRYASALIVLFTQFLALGEVLWSLLMRPKRTPRKPALYLCSMIGILMITTVYRLAAMGSNTTSLTSMGPGSLNGPTAKALFYVFHVTPEWLSSAMLLAVNVKETFGITSKSH